MTGSMFSKQAIGSACGVPRAAGGRLLLFLVAAFALLPVSKARALPRDGFVDAKPSDGAFCLVAAGHAAAVCVAENDYAGVARAAGDLCQDVGRVSGVATGVVHAADASAMPPVLVGTVGQSTVIDTLVRTGKLDVSGVRGQWESYVVQTVSDPMPGVRQALVIAGSDRRGTIYGIYDLSENIGVSPWYWWADVPVPHRDAVYVRAGRIVQGPPAVKYRGIFLNDEAPALTGWAKEKFGGLNSKMYTHVFELLLRLRANYLWPAMWGNAFNEDDPENPRLADAYGIVMGTSHQEPMLRAQGEFDRRHQPSDWNFATHPDLMEQFWREGVRRNRQYESLITVGMRGRNDTPMIEHATTQQSMTLLEQIVARQRKIIAEEINPDVTQVPQLWCLYKEVQGYYEQGLRVPEEVTLLWADDNWGNLRRLPTPDERKRVGGAGIYYHFDYVGDPRNYKWLNTNPLPKIQEQMNLAYQYGADRIWIVNVGDLKPMELPIDFFLTMAWNPGAMTKDRVNVYTKTWAAEQFGPGRADAIADMLGKYGKFSGWRKPELISPDTFSLINYDEAGRVETAWLDLETTARQAYDTLPAEYRDAFFQLVLYPIEASSTFTRMYIAAGRNALFARQGRESANAQADRVRTLFKRDQEISDAYNHGLARGKWDHMMDQTHIGYTGWQQPPKNVMPVVTEVTPDRGEAIGVAVEGAVNAWPQEKGDLRLPPFDTLGKQTRWIDVFRRGQGKLASRLVADRPWVRIESLGSVQDDQRSLVSIDWSRAPAGESDATIRISGPPEGGTAAVRVHVVHDPAARIAAAGAYGSLSEAFAVPAAGFSGNVPANGVAWQLIPDYGREAAAMAVYPVTAASVVPPADAPCLEYPVYFANAGPIEIDALIGPTLAFVPGRGLRLALSIDAAEPQIVDAKMTVMGRDGVWRNAVSDNTRVLAFMPTIATPGRHTVKVRMVDPGVVLQRLVVNAGARRPSYFGPPLAKLQRGN